MNYLSADNTYRTDLRGALLCPSAPDGSLWLPESFQVLPAAFIRNIAGMNPEEIAFAVCNILLDGLVDGQSLREVIHQSFGIPMPLVQAGDINIAELFHGPTLSYKDIGARFATGITGKLLSNEKRQAIGIVATTGNTGAAMAATFRQNMPGDSRLLVLYPSGKMTRAQISQFTTPGNHVTAIEVAGTIDDCRSMARHLSRDIMTERPDLLPIVLNSDNALRVIPQVAVFFNIYAALLRGGRRADGFSVLIPSGNLTNFTAALIARSIGLPIGEIVAVTAEKSTYARAIAAAPLKANRDRADRLTASLPPDVKLSTANVSDTEIGDTIRDYGSLYLPDPQTAAALKVALERPSGAGDPPTVVLATAHPAKSLDAMTAITGRAMEMPLQLTEFMHNTRPAARIAPSLQALKKYLKTLV